ncbi:MAG: T9SS type A sorting domain-containing protein [Rhodothermales bacterium]|nr:T9SS type A sorting domain-containing protein [Rhodothermales bacterium]
MNLRDEYKPAAVQSLSSAKDLLYGTIDRKNDGSSDGVRCVYSGFFVAFDGSPSSDPSQDVFNSPNENSVGINLEHTWPQSKGAGSGSPQSNMHHLFPTKVNVNSARGSLPFGEVTDALATTWFRGSDLFNSMPTQERDEYSELLSGQRFEPREDHKGNVARAMFYFYTMYKSEADAADPSFFEQQRDVLRTWHELDPVDTDEIARNDAIAAFQSGKTNPFIQDQTLVDRAYFESAVDLSGATGDQLAVGIIELFPNPAVDQVTVRINKTPGQRSSVVLYDMLGRAMATSVTSVDLGSITELRLDISTISRGIYWLQVQNGPISDAKSILIL